MSRHPQLDRRHSAPQNTSTLAHHSCARPRVLPRTPSPSPSRHLRNKRDEELQRKFEYMRRAIQEQEIDPALFREANRREDPRARSAAEVEMLKRAIPLRGQRKPFNRPL
ncbi:hypothetical protein JVT61DRAFT_5198 [Boletus reticuloceps]|uniref:Uncharacterized protein n=1 Tax=Boletus reticuloceps TaxID=495285 RepID=A0A8I2YWP0_9AGAM|nr:hypothetical protein JVT61DRAFT_5198 [Boletus reticuloceps]